MTAPAAGPPTTLRWPAHKVKRGHGAANGPALGSAVGLAAILLCLPGQASAQVGVRGQSDALSDRRPALSLNLSYDHPSGVYAGGGILTRASFLGADGDAAGRFVGHNEYLGYSGPLGADRSWDVGVSNQAYTLDYERKISVHYTEAYVGLVQGDLSAHVYFAPNYPRRGVSSAYADINASHRFADVWRLTGHLGAHERLSGTPARDGRPWRFDTQLGIAREFTRAEVDLAWIASAPGPLPHPPQSRSGVVLAAKYFF
jgi:uncharacterized protein (TIGR02001 family)